MAAPELEAAGVSPETADGMLHALPNGLGRSPAIADLRDVPAEPVRHPIFGVARCYPHRERPVDDDRAGVGAATWPGRARTARRGGAGASGRWRGRSSAVGRARLAMFPSWRARRRYLKRSSKACRPDLGPADCVSRSTVVRGFQSVQSLRASFTAILAAIGCRHCSRAPGSKNAHCVHAWSSAPHWPQRALLTSARDNSPAQRAQRMTSRHFIRFGARGPSGCSARG